MGTPDVTLDPAGQAGYTDHPPRIGFFTDTSVCIGCKACEVACKEWNAVPEDGLLLTGMSYDNTGGLSASTWRHVAFIEQVRPVAVAPTAHDGGASTDSEGTPELRWLMSSDVCKHCTHAGCLDVCPTGALMRTEFGTVVVQDDICNGCGYCVSACPFGVIDRRQSDGGAHKCTLCYDRLGDGLTPACAKACPTQSIQFGPLDQLRERAQHRVAELHDGGSTARHGCTVPIPMMAWAGRERSFCCWPSPRCTACHRTLWSRHGTCLACGGTPPSPPPPSPCPPSPPAWRRRS